MESRTEDARFATRLEAELDAAHARIETDNKRLNEALTNLAARKAELENLRPLARAATDLRQEARKAVQEKEAALYDLQSAKISIHGLEAKLAETEAKVARLEAELSAYDALNARVRDAGHVFDLIP